MLDVLNIYRPKHRYIHVAGNYVLLYIERPLLAGHIWKPNNQFKVFVSQTRFDERMISYSALTGLFWNKFCTYKLLRCSIYHWPGPVPPPGLNDLVRVLPHSWVLVPHQMHLGVRIGGCGTC